MSFPSIDLNSFPASQAEFDTNFAARSAEFDKTFAASRAKFNKDFEAMSSKIKKSSEDIAVEAKKIEKRNNIIAALAIIGIIGSIVAAAVTQSWPFLIIAVPCSYVLKSLNTPPPTHIHHHHYH